MPLRMPALQSPLGRAVYLGVAKDLSEAAPRFALPEGLVPRAATEEDFPRLVELMQAPDFRGKRLQMADLVQRYSRGDKCILGEYRGEIIGVSWVRFDSAAYPLAGIDVPLKRHEAYLGAIFARPHVRGRGMTAGAAHLVYTWLKERGITTVYGWVQPRNRPMVRTMLRLDWTITSRVTQYFVWIGMRFPILNIVRVTDFSDSLCGWCARDRIRFRSGIRIFEQGTIETPDSAKGIRAPSVDAE